jgi:plasmid stabilization system protein ParE
VSRAKHAIRLLAAAEQDFADIIDYVLAENPLAAIKLAERIEKNLLNLQANPQLGRIPNDEKLLRMGYRYLIVLDYLIFYKIEDRNILIYRIVDGARDYKNLL